MTQFVKLGLATAVTFGLPLSSPGQPPPIGPATVGEWTIRTERIERFVEHRLRGQIVEAAIQRQLLEEAREQLVDRQVILSYLQSTPHRAGPNQIRLKVEELTDRLRQQDLTLEDHLERRQMTRQELENELAWTIAWEQYLEAQLTGEALRRFYEKNRREFDGTRLEVAHILLRPAADHPEAGRERASEIRRKLTSGELSWNEAVRQYSQAESSLDSAGRIGWIGYDGPMPPAFSHAAFELDPGQISEPVATTFGIHLIQCLAVEPGTRGPDDVRDRLKEAATRFLFEKLAREKRAAIAIEYGD